MNIITFSRCWITPMWLYTTMYSWQGWACSKDHLLIRTKYCRSPGVYYLCYITFIETHNTDITLPHVVSTITSTLKTFTSYHQCIYQPLFTIQKRNVLSVISYLGVSTNFSISITSSPNDFIPSVLADWSWAENSSGFIAILIPWKNFYMPQLQGMFQDSWL